MISEGKRKLRIAMLGHKRIPSREGGVEIVVSELSSGMTGLGHNVVCYNRKGHHVSGEEFDKAGERNFKGVILKEVPTIDKKGLAAMTSSFFAAICAAFGNYDVVHFHAEGPCAVMWIPKLFGKRCIATVHGLDHQRAKWGGFASKYILFGEKCAVKCADEIIVLSENVKNYFESTYNRKTVFIPNGVNRPLSADASVIKDKFSLTKDDYILYLGRLVPEKGIRYLLEAYKNLDTEKKLVIAGGSSDTDEFAKELRKIAEDDDRIIFTGFVEGRTLEELYSNAYIYVLPSDLEGMPLSLLEAMSYSNCCLTSDIPECAEVTGEYGVTFRKSDTEDLQRVLQHLCDNESVVKSYKENAADYICNKYSWQDVVEKTLSLYTASGQAGVSAGEEKRNESLVSK